jgi:hypothetical protein
MLWLRTPRKHVRTIEDLKFGQLSYPFQLWFRSIYNLSVVISVLNHSLMDAFLGHALIWFVNSFGVVGNLIQCYFCFSFILSFLIHAF